MAISRKFIQVILIYASLMFTFTSLTADVFSAFGDDGLQYHNRHTRYIASLAVGIFFAFYKAKKERNAVREQGS